MKKPLSKTIRNWYGVGDCFFDLQTNFGTYYQSFFTTNIACVPLPMVSGLAAINGIINIALSPFYGIIVDKIPPMKWGRYRSILLVVAPIAELLVVLRYFMIAWTAQSSLYIPIMLAFGIFSGIIFQALWSANLSMIPTIASDPGDNNHLTSRRWAWIQFGKIILGYTALALITFWTKYVGEVYAYPLTSLAYAILAVGGLWIHFAMTKGYEDDSTTMRAAAKKGITFKEVIQALIANKHCMVMFFAYICTAIGSFAVAMMASYYFNLVAENPALLAFYLSITNFAAMAGAFISGILGKKYNLKTLSVISMVVLVAAFAACRAVALTSATLYTVFMVITQFAHAFNSPIFTTFFGNSAVYAKWKTGKDASATIMGVTAMPISIAATLVGTLIPIILQRTGFVAGEAISMATKSGIATAAILLPLAGYALGLVIILFGWKLTNEQVQQYNREIAEREASQV